MKSSLHLLGPVLIAAAMLTSACDSVDSNLSDGPEANVPSTPNGAAKVNSFANLAQWQSVGFTDGNGDNWTLAFQTNLDVGGNVTEFSYQVTKPAGGCIECDVSEITLSYVIPECASYVGGSASPAPSSTSGDTLFWVSSVFATGNNSLTLDFNTPSGLSQERLGVVQVGLESPGDGAPTMDFVLGPCNAIYDLEGTVFLNDTSDEDVPANDDQEAGEPGIPDVEVAVQEYVGGAWQFDDSPRQLTDADGDYSFSVIGPPAPGMPSMYRVVVLTDSDSVEAVNESLFGGIFMPSCVDDCADESNPAFISKEADLDSGADIDFGFEVDLEGAIAKFDAGALYADGFGRKYWRRQAEGNPHGNLSLDYSKGEFLDLLNCSDGSFDPPGAIECIFDPSGNLNDFLGADDSMIEQILPIDGVDDLVEAQELLKKVPGSQLSKQGAGKPDNPPGNKDKYLTLQRELQQQILIALLNYTVGRGVCKGDLGADGRCLEVDEPAMRILVTNAIIVLVESEFSVGKASSGKVGSNSELLDRTSG